MPAMALIVVVDIDDEIRSLLREVLEAMGPRVQGFSDAWEAIVRVDFSKVDLVVADVYAPYVSGFTLLEFLQDTGVKVPVFVMGGYLPKEYQQRCLELGACCFLQKPFQVRELWNRVEENLV